MKQVYTRLNMKNLTVNKKELKNDRMILCLTNDGVFFFFLSLSRSPSNQRLCSFLLFLFYYYYYYSVMLFVYIYISIVDARFLFYMCSKKKSRTKRIELLKISQSLETIVLSLKVMFLSHRSRNPKIIRARKLVFSGR